MPARRVIRCAIAVLAVLVSLSACGSDDTSTPADARGSVVDAIVAQMTTFGFDADRACVAGLVAQLDDADFALMAEATKDTSPDATDPQLSAAGEALGEQMGTCVDQKNADSPLIQQVLDAFDSTEHEGMTLDEDCARTQLGALSDEQLQAFLDLGPDTTDPHAAPGQLALIGCADISFGGEATLSEDVCALFDPSVLGSLTDGMGAGDPVGLISTSGTTAAGCKFSAADGSSVTVYVTRDADVAAWAAAATDGDGSSDATVAPNIGDQAFMREGYAGASRGTTIVELRVFPSFSADGVSLPDVLTQLLAQIAD